MVHFKKWQAGLVWVLFIVLIGLGNQCRATMESLQPEGGQKDLREVVQDFISREEKKFREIQQNRDSLVKSTPLEEKANIEKCFLSQETKMNQERSKEISEIIATLLQLQKPEDQVGVIKKYLSIEAKRIQDLMAIDREYRVKYLSIEAKRMSDLVAIKERSIERKRNGKNRLPIDCEERYQKLFYAISAYLGVCFGGLLVLLVEKGYLRLPTAEKRIKYRKTAPF